MRLATINSIWIGKRLGSIHAACLRSFLRHWHKVILHVFERPHDVPDGIILSHAGDLVPRDAIRLPTAGGRPAVIASLLRYEILARGLGLYVDCDCYCLRPIEDAEMLFGWESATHVNNAVLKLPVDSPVLVELREMWVSRAFIPP